MAHTAEPAPRHLRIVGEDDIPMGVTWEAPADQVHVTDAAVSEAEKLPPLEPTPAARPEPADAATEEGERLRERVRAILADAAATSWGYVRVSGASYVEVASLWTRAEGVEDAYLSDADIAREKTRAALKKRLDRVRTEEDRKQLAKQLEALDSSWTEWKTQTGATLKAAGTRVVRGLVCVAVPIGAAVGPLYLAGSGLWWALAAYPVGYLTMAWMGRIRTLREAGPAPAATIAATEPRRKLRDVVGATAAENRILTALEGRRWEEAAKARGLEGIAPVDVALDENGIRCVLTLGGTWTTDKLRKAADRVRALLAVPTATRIEITPGDKGDESVLRIRTRAKELDTAWSPSAKGIGLDTDSGEVVDLPKGRKLVAGTSGAGKSVLVRVIMAAALISDEPTAVVYIDGKGEESALWVGMVRIAVEPEEISSVVEELVHEGNRRRDIMRERGVATWTPTKDDPRIVIVVDEGAEVMAMDSKDTPMLAGLQTIARTGRSRCLDLVWCTQKPTIGDGIDRQINGVMEIRTVLRTAGENETRQVLGTGWPNHTWTGVGLCVVKGTGRDSDQAPVAVWNLSDDATVKALPDTEPWIHPQFRGDAEGDGDAAAAALPDVLALALELSEGLPGVHTETLAAAAGLMDFDVSAALRECGVHPEKNAFRINGERGRGYRREVLEEAADRYRK